MAKNSSHIQNHKNLRKFKTKQGGRGHKPVNRFKYIKTTPVPVNFDNNSRNTWEALCKRLMPRVVFDGPRL